MRSRSFLVIAFLALSAGVGIAAPVPKSLRAEAEAASKIDRARFKATYVNTPYAKLFEVLAEGTGLKFVGEVPPLGTITLDLCVAHNAAQFIELLNGALEQKKYVLIRHRDTFYLHSLDQPINRDKVDTVPADELLPPEPPKRDDPAPVVAKKPNAAAGVGNPNAAAGVGQLQRAQFEGPPPPKRSQKEVVRHVLNLRDGLKAKDALPQVKKLLSPLGVVEDGKNDGELVVTDWAANVRNAMRQVTPSK